MGLNLLNSVTFKIELVTKCHELNRRRASTCVTEMHEELKRIVDARRAAGDEMWRKIRKTSKL